MRKCLVLVLLCAAIHPLLSQEKKPITSYEVYFSPQDKLADQLISLLNKEKKSVRIAVYCLMHRGIADALIRAKKRGVDVEVIVDPFSVKSRSPVHKLNEEGIALYVWNPDDTYHYTKGKKIKNRKPLMHDKFCVLGNEMVWTGSFNFTRDASQSHQENAVLLESESIAMRYLEEFDEIREECVSYNCYLK